jgi:hypothetical protein
VSTTAPPTPSPTTQSPTGLGDAWEPIELPGERPEAVAAASGSGALVIAGRRCIGPKTNSCTPEAAAWRSVDDGATWQPTSIEDGTDTFPREVVFTGTSFVAFGIRHERGGEGRRSTGLLWRSTDGADWRRAGSIDLGACTEEGCPYASGLVAVGDAGLLLANVSSSISVPGDAYRSVDGETWTRIPPSAFGLEDGDAPVMTAATATSDGVLALVTGRSLPMTAWRSTDGVTWTAAGAFDSVPNTTASVTSDVAGEAIVVARELCEGRTCATRIWTGSASAGSVFEPTTAEFAMIGARVVSAGAAGYLLVGRIDGVPAAFTSRNGRTWTKGDPGPEAVACGVGWLAGGPSLAIHIPELGCGGASITRPS